MPPRKSVKAGSIPCRLRPQTKKAIKKYIEELIMVAPHIGSHGLSEDDFWRSGIFRGAIESIRGTQAASMAQKKEFLDEVLGYLKSKKKIQSFGFTGAGDRHDYQVIMDDHTDSIIEAKGCLDGNNTTVYQRPPNADEFMIWSLCQNPGADPPHNAWSGIHTRLGGKIIAEKELVDGLVIWDMLCGTIGRPCPKLEANPERAVTLQTGREVPPPCIYLFPRTVPDPRNNPNPRVWKIEEIKLLHALWTEFNGTPEDITEVHIEARMNGVHVERRTTLIRGGIETAQSEWTQLKRAR